MCTVPGPLVVAACSPLLCVPSHHSCTGQLSTLKRTTGDFLTGHPLNSLSAKYSLYPLTLGEILKQLTWDFLIRKFRGRPVKKVTLYNWVQWRTVSWYHQCAQYKHTATQHLAQTTLLVTLALSWHCQALWSVAPQLVHLAWQTLCIKLRTLIGMCKLTIPSSLRVPLSKASSRSCIFLSSLLPSGTSTPCIVLHFSELYCTLLYCTVSVLLREEGYTMKYSLSSREIPRAKPEGFPRAQAIFHCISWLKSQYRHYQLQLQHWPSWEKR